MFNWLTARKANKRIAERLYGVIVAQSRLPGFYAGHGVPDSVTGRFEMIVLHMFLVQERLQAAVGEPSAPAERLGQALNEAFIADMDDAMREMGVADVRVGERMHQAAGAYFGRLMAYRKALTADSTADGPGYDALAKAIARNVLADATGTECGKDLAARALGAYARSAANHLAGLPLSTMLAGTMTFPTPNEPRQLGKG